MRSHHLSVLAATAFLVGCTGVLSHELSNSTARRPVPEPRPLPAPAASYMAAMAEIRSAEAESRAVARASRAETALNALAGLVVEQSAPDALRYAFEAYFNYRAAHPEKVRKPYLYFVDYGLDNRTARGYVFDMEALTLVDGPFPVAHGRGSSSTRDGVPTRFSNRRGSNSTSLGLYLAQETYDFRGSSGGRRYRSIGLRLRGLSGRFNSAARERGVVVHGAPYVTSRAAGRSEGCPAMEQDRAERLIPKIANGGLVFLYSPRDTSWLRDEPWVPSFVGMAGAAD